MEGDEIVMYTPDQDLYMEKVGCKGDQGPIKLRGLLPNGNVPRNLTAPAYRFREKVTDDLIRQVFRDSLALADGESKSYTMPAQAVNHSFSTVSIDALFGGKFLRTRVLRGRGHEAEIAAGNKAVAPGGTPKNANPWARSEPQR